MAAGTVIINTMSANNAEAQQIMKREFDLFIAVQCVHHDGQSTGQDDGAASGSYAAFASAQALKFPPLNTAPPSYNLRNHVVR